ncbi:peptide/nickel transport system permease protein [Marmoricola sp. URHA0025 HA25]
MGRYVVTRLLQCVFVLWGVTVVVFIAMHVVPGDPARAVLGPRATEEAVTQLQHELGLDQSLVHQYANYLGELTHGKLGDSITDHAPVADLVRPRLEPSFLLVGISILLSLAAAIPLATLSALRANTIIDHTVRLASVVLYAIPSFWFGLILAIVFGLKLSLFPTSGFDGGSPAGIARTLTLPAITVSLFVFPILMRLLRASTLETLQAEYVESARARGLSGGRVLARHALRNSLTSSVTYIGASIGTLLSIDVAVEQVFALPGLGSLLVHAVQVRDYTTIQAVTFIFASAVVLGNLAADLMYMFLDPRVRM